MPDTASVDTSGGARLHARLGRIVNPAATPLMCTWMRIIDDDNRRGILSGVDCNGSPMAPVKYRPVPPTAKLTANQKNNPKRGAKRGQFAGFGRHPAGLINNLSSPEYRHLAGPPLAPRGAFSRVVTNLKLRFGQLGVGAWEAVGYWDEVVSRTGRQFLTYLFDGLGRRGSIPRRDLRGVRPDGKAKAAKACRAWMIDLIRREG